MNEMEIFALNHTLSDWPDGLTYEQVQSLIMRGSGRISVWEKMEDWSSLDVCMYQDELKSDVEELLRGRL
jgi:hypothetical protein